MKKDIRRSPAYRAGYRAVQRVTLRVALLVALVYAAVFLVRAGPPKDMAQPTLLACRDLAAYPAWSPGTPMTAEVEAWSREVQQNALRSTHPVIRRGGAALAPEPGRQMHPDSVRAAVERMRQTCERYLEVRG
jgi:hypothetical protein